MPPEPPRPPRSNYRLVFWSLVVIVGLLTATLGVVVASTRDSDDVARDDPSRDTDEPETTDPPADAPTAAELEALVAEISTFVEEERGLAFKRPVAVELAAGDEFTERLLADFEDEEAELAETQVLFEAFGLLEPGTSLSEVLQDALGGGVIGFYDPETDELVVRGAALTPSVRVTIAHELTHALDDQHFELERPAYDADDSDDADGDGIPDEVPFGFTSLVEGSASVVDEAYLESLSDDERDEYDDEQADMSGGMPDVPEIVLSQIGLPYVLGPVLVAALETAGGQERLDAAYAEPPSTSEGVMHPDLYLAGEGAVEVPQPEVEPGGEVVGEPSVMGELFTVLVLSEEIPSPDAFAAGRGWGGDLLVTWSDGDRSCVRTTMVGDSAEETAELYDAWSEWAESAPVEATITPLDAADPFTVTSCGTAAASASEEAAPR